MPIQITIPTGLELVVNVPKIVSRVGYRVAGNVRKRLTAGMGADGALPVGDGTPLRDTGQLIRSIKFQKRGKFGGLIGPTGTRTDGKRNAMIFWVHMHRMLGLKAADPMGVDKALSDVASVEANAEVRRQTTTKEARLKARGSKKR